MKLSKLIFQAIFLVAFLSILVVMLSSIYFQYQDFENEKKALKEEFFSQNKELLKNEVDKVLDFIEYKQNRDYEEVKKTLIQRVNNAHNVAMAIYEENRDSMSEQQIKQLIVSTLKHISFDNKRAYYFINTNDGKAILFNTESKLGQNINVWNLQNKNGTYFIQEQAKIARNFEKGFIKNYFVKPDLNDNTQYPKLTYVANFEPYDWHIGTGAYIDDEKNRLKDEILDWISTVRFGNQGYIYANTLDGHALVFNGQKLKKPKYWAENPVFQKEVNAALDKNNHYFNYKFQKLNSDEKFNKLGYVVFYSDFQWLIGTGVYIDEINLKLHKERDELTQSIIYQSIMFLVLTCFLILFVYIISKRIEKFLDSSINYLKYIFNKASKEYYDINMKKISFVEFQILAKSLNEMLKSREEVEKKLRNYLKIVDSNVIIFSTNTEGYITEVSKALCKLSHYTKAELVGRHFTVLYDTKSSLVSFKEVWRYIRRVNAWSGEAKCIDKNGYTYWLQVYIHANIKDKKVVDYTVIAEDITDKKRVEFLSITDGLTHLYNRRYFNERISSEVNRVKRAKGYLALMVIDVDFFKMYNDTYGHIEGDVVLKEVAKVLKSLTQRATDYAFRLGGEEFGLIFECEQPQNAQIYANKLITDIEKLKIKHSHSATNYLTVSGGLVVKYYDEITNSDELYKQADNALYKAKETGRNKIVIES